MSRKKLYIVALNGLLCSLTSAFPDPGRVSVKGKCIACIPET
ncbi:MAG: hypothetical protein GY697_22875 [Desulfobacterales bacterium]|nr:hypothetical protein [Desulfobacterales bacterium]